MQEHGFPAVAVGVYASRKHVFDKAYGHADVGQGRQATTNDRYQIGSVTKSFVGLMLATMLESGQVSLDDPLGALWPEGGAALGAPEPTIREIATHTAGLPRYPENLQREDGDPILGFTEEQMLEGLRATRSSRRQSGQYEYSNFGYGLLATALSKRDGRSLEASMQAMVLRPLRLRNTSFIAPVGKGFATPYRDDDPLVPTLPWRMGTLSGAGGLYSTTGDLARFASYLASPDSAPSTALAAALRRVQSPLLRLPTPEGWSYGLGVFVVPDYADDIDIVWHGGDVDGYAATFVAAPESGIGLSILTNRGIGRPLGNFQRELLRDAVAAFGQGDTLAPVDNVEGRGSASLRREP